MHIYKDEQGIPYLDLEEASEGGTLLLMQHGGGTRKRELQAVSLVQTVRGNYEGYSKREVLKVKEARRAQAMMGNPSEADYKGMVSHNLIPNCSVASSGITNASPEHARKNGTEDARAGGCGLCCSSARASSSQQDSDVSGRCVFCGRDSVLVDRIPEDQVCYGGAHSGEDRIEPKQTHGACVGSVWTRGF